MKMPDLNWLICYCRGTGTKMPEGTLEQEPVPSRDWELDQEQRRIWFQTRVKFRVWSQAWAESRAGYGPGPDRVSDQARTGTGSRSQDQRHA